jgi:hypothetical protein
MTRRRPWWRWLIVQTYENGHREIVWGFFTRRDAQHEAIMTRIHQAGMYPGVPRPMVTVEKASRKRLTVSRNHA